MGELSDVDLVREAQAGNIGALSLVLGRHEAGMRAVAFGVLGYRPDVEDAVQEAFLTAVRRIGDLREPAAVGGWLRTVVRNQCRMQLRARRPVPVDDLDQLVPARIAPDGRAGLDPADLLERQALGDWVWHAVNALPPSLHEVTLLRYFTSVTAYEQIAAVCGIPLGTVRSRLSQARARLADNLRRSADLAHPDHLAATEARRQEADHVLGAALTGDYAAAMAEVCVPDVETIWGQGKRTRGLDYPVASMYRDVGDGVDFRLTDVVAGRDTLIWETALISPPEDPFHCPPSAVWVHRRRSGRAGRTYRMRLFHPVRGPMPHPGLDRVGELVPG